MLRFITATFGIPVRIQNEIVEAISDAELRDRKVGGLP
jgi:hypothetical protein